MRLNVENQGVFLPALVLKQSAVLKEQMVALPWAVSAGLKDISPALPGKRT